jgi:hypothetical protein
MKDLVPGRPAAARRSLLSSISWEDLLERFRLLCEETFIVSSVAAALDDDEGEDEESSEKDII